MISIFFIVSGLITIKLWTVSTLHRKIQRLLEIKCVSQFLKWYLNLVLLLCRVSPGIWHSFPLFMLTFALLFIWKNLPQFYLLTVITVIDNRWFKLDLCFVAVLSCVAILCPLFAHYSKLWSFKGENPVLISVLDSFTSFHMFDS